MKNIWIVEYEYEGNWCWPYAEIGWAFPSRSQALDAATKLKGRGSPTQIRKFNQEEAGGKG